MRAIDVTLFGNETFIDDSVGANTKRMNNPYSEYEYDNSSNDRHQ